MKPALLTLALLFACYSMSFSQKWEIGLNGGIVWNTPPLNVSQEYRNSSDPSLTAGIKLIRDLKRWQFGLSVNVLQLVYTNAHAQHSWLPEYEHSKTVLADPAVPVCFFLDRKINLKHIELYAGISAGYVSITIPFQDYWSGGNTKLHRDGFIMGAQLGGNYYITKHIGLNAEINVNEVVLDVNSSQSPYLLAFPTTIGIRYRF